MGGWGFMVRVPCSWMAGWTISTGDKLSPVGYLRCSPKNNLYQPLLFTPFINVSYRHILASRFSQKQSFNMSKGLRFSAIPLERRVRTHTPCCCYQSPTFLLNGSLFFSFLRFRMP